MNINFKKMIRNENGSALTMSLTAVVVSVITALAVMKSGQERLDQSSDMMKNSVIENSVLEIRTLLANPIVCTQAMEQTPAFSQIGDFKESTADADAIIPNVFLESIDVQNETSTEKRIVLRFEKRKKGKTDFVKSYKTDAVKIKVFSVPNPTAPDDRSQDLLKCASFATNAVENTIKQLCEDVLHGTYSSITGQCTNQDLLANPEFTARVNEAACEVLGGTYSSGSCDKIALAGDIKSSHFKPGSITLNDTTLNNSQTKICTGLNVVNKYKANGLVNCAPFTCDSPDYTGASTYIPIQYDGKLACQCDMKRSKVQDEHQAGCGERSKKACQDTDVVVDDGCGTNTQCVVKAMTKTELGCPTNPTVACGEVLRSSSCPSVICAVGDACPAVADDDSGDDSGGDSGDDDSATTPEPSTSNPVCSNGSTSYDSLSACQSSGSTCSAAYFNADGSTCSGVTTQTCDSAAVKTEVTMEEYAAGAGSGSGTCRSSSVGYTCNDDGELEGLTKPYCVSVSNWRRSADVKYYKLSCNCTSSTSTSSCSQTKYCPSTSSGSTGGGTGGTTLPTPCSGNWEECNCFTAGTMISMADGSLKNIEDIKIGDRVKGSNGINTVLKLKPSTHSGSKYSINGSGYFVTEGHPFMTQDGWKAFNPEMAMEINPTLEIKKLQIGDELIREEGRETIISIDFHKNDENIYNFELDGTKDYYADGYLVHNK